MLIRLITDLLTNTVFKLMAPNSNSMVTDLVSQVVTMLKRDFKDDIREFMKKLAVGVVLVGVGTAAIISSFRMAEEIIRPLPDGPWILLASYIIISFLCVGGVFFLFRKEKVSVELKTELKTELKNSYASENNDIPRESQGSPSFFGDADVQSSLKNILHAFSESFAQSYKKSEHSDFRKGPAVDADGDARVKGYEDVETPYYKRPYASDSVSNSRK